MDGVWSVSLQARVALTNPHDLAKDIRQRYFSYENLFSYSSSLVQSLFRSFSIILVMEIILVRLPV